MYLNENGLYVPEDISFVNTRDFTRAGQHFAKHKCYTFAPEDSLDYEHFWDIEEERILNGMTLPGKLIIENGITKIQDVHITGEHYFYLNYVPIRKLDRFGDVDEGVYKLIEESNRKVFGFADFWDGDYHYFKARQIARQNGQHIAVGKSRRKGFTYKAGGTGSRNAAFFPRTNVVMSAYDYKYICGVDQLMPMCKTILDHLEGNTDFGRHYLNASDTHIRLGYREEKSKIDKGYLSNIFAVSFMDNPKAAIGKDAVEINIEEAGDCPNLDMVLTLTQPTLRAGSVSTGMMTVFGAITESGGNWEKFKHLFYHPKAYGFMSFQNIHEKDYARNECGYFFPYQMNYETAKGEVQAMDEHGNSNLELALKLIEIEDAAVKGDKTPHEFLVHKAQYATKPSEAFFDVTGGYFSSPGLIKHYEELLQNPVYRNVTFNGFLRYNGKEIVREFKNPKNDREAIPITQYPIPKDWKDFEGCITEYTTPYKDKNGNIPDGMYVATNDSFGTDKRADLIQSEDSLGATYIYERANRYTPYKGDRLVASYIGRPEKMFEYDENMFRLIERWNAKLGFENDRGTVIPNARILKKTHLLLEEPELDFKKEVAGKRGRDYGMHMSPTRKPIARKFLKEWLHSVRGHNQSTGEPIYNYHYIQDVGLLEELIKYGDGNFDRVSSLFILMYYIKELEETEIVDSNNNVDNLQFFDNFDLFN